MQKATDDEIRAFLDVHRHWSLNDGKLHRKCEFSNFVEAFGFMTKVAMIAESQNHHPEWSNVYNKVTVDLTTHAAGGITEKDFEFVQEIDGLFSR